MQHFYFPVNNTEPTEAMLNILERGFLYGDGFFTTALVVENKVIHRKSHLNRLQNSAMALDFKQFDLAELEHAIPKLDGVQWLKVIITRGTSQSRGYAPPDDYELNVYWLYGPTARPELTSPLCLSICNTPISINPKLAGLKTLNALDRVLAQAECKANGVDEGVMLIDGNTLVCATHSNLFFISDDTVFTPALTKAGVAGTTRAFLLDYCEQQGIRVVESDIAADQLADFEACCITNALKGVREVSQIEQFTYHKHPIITQWQNAFLTAVND